MKKTIVSTVLLFFVAGITQLFAYVTPESGKVYRIHNVKSDKVISEDCIARQLASVDAAGNDDFKQLWLLKESNNGYTIQNAYSGQYLHHCAQQSTRIYPTGAEEAVMYLTQVNGTQYAIGQASGAYLHLDGSNNIVRWWDKDNTSSQWQFEEVKVSEEAISLQQAAFQKFYAEYQAKLELMQHVDEYNALLPTFFTDLTCTELQPSYVQMDDAALRTAMAALPISLQDMAVKIKNKAWGHREEEFRVRNYKAYSDPDYWANVLYTKKYGRINNPTGIYGQAGDVLYIFVGDDVPEGATLKAEVINGSGIQGTAYDLKKGLNMVPTVKDYSNLFIQYVGNTSLESDVLITDYPALKIHVEQGVVNGFWNKEEHDDADWVDMMANLATADVFQVKGERIMFHMSRYYLKQFCPNTITDAIGWWDDMTRWQQDMLGIEDVRLTKFNNLNCAISLTSGYQSATHYRTQYLDSYTGNLLPYERMMSNADNCWGPAHENGHVHQAAIQSVGTSEVSNNFFSNLTLNKLGKFVSRGSANSVIFNDYGNHKPYILRDGASTMRMFWQLYLYFHEAQVDTTFYPRVLQAMRATPMKARDPKYYANYVYGNEDLLLFAKACCDVAQLDLSEFFRFWGYLELTDKQHIGDYGDFYLTTRQSDVDEFLAHAAQYPKAPSIIFIEDRVKPVLRTDGGDGHKLHHGTSVSASEAGDLGHYTDFMDISAKADGYLFSKAGSKVTITEGTGALGFKVYAKADDALLYGSNKLTFTLPDEVAAQDIYIVAAQADGTDVPVLSVAEGGDEEQQYAALATAIKQAQATMAMSDDKGMKPGYYFGSAVKGLSVLLDSASQAYDAKDQRTHSYGEWATLLDAEMRRLAADPAARQVIYAANWYALYNANYPSYSMATSGTKLRCTIADPTGSDAKQWAFEPAGDGTYYIRCKSTGNYISSIAQSVQVSATATTTASAVKFTVTDNGNGTFSINDESQNYGALHCDAGKTVVGWQANSTASTWSLTCLVDGQSELFDSQLSRLVTRAQNILGEIIVDYSSDLDAAAPMTLQPDVTPLVGADTLLTWAAELQAYVLWWDQTDEEIDNYLPYIDAVSALIDQLVAGYKKALAMPEVSAEDGYVLYYIKPVDEELYLSYEKTAPRYLTYLRTVSYAPSYSVDYDDPGFLWYFLPADVAGQYYIVNSEVGVGAYAVSGKSNLAVDASVNTPALPFVITPDEEQGGYVVSTDAGQKWTTNSSDYVQTSDKKSVIWQFVKVGKATSITSVETIEASGQLYDLMGRRVENPTPGIYIRGGKKIVIGIQ
ncbi:MAG: M60 family metallopeptidase [Bacteroidaceae bacterium]|nr:M60 family metallopeptidase [Bacteroidaceae bacterium]